MQKIELLAPAANAATAIEAIKHGADAVYMGARAFGARKSAANSIEDIRRVIEYAHPFGAKVYAAVNTIIYENELTEVEKLIRELHAIGTDAIIVQDMGILRLDIPPIPLHASTQCDTRTPEKARFLQDAGFSQIVLARELTLREIREIKKSVSVPLECFIHGALCVSYSGRCHASLAAKGRSANRGECAQICRLPFTLSDRNGTILAHDRHLLSLKDLNLSDRLEDMMIAGVSSFKIEGRLKDADYVKNITSFYRQRIDSIIRLHPDKFRRASAGESEITFPPDPAKSFNRGFTHYFLDSRRPADISSPRTPKSMGETISDIRELNNGDGISFFNSNGEYEGAMVNGISGSRIISNRPIFIPRHSAIHRTFNLQWQKIMAKPSAERRLALDVEMHPAYLKATDERGVSAIVSLNADPQPARTPRDLREVFDKFGNTIFRLRNFKVEMEGDVFIPASCLADARRRLVEALMGASRATYLYELRRREDTDAKYPCEELDYRDNVANTKAREFYLSHGVKRIAPAMETERVPQEGSERIVMTTRHCILREMGKCLRETPEKERGFRLPLKLQSGKLEFNLDFDCRRCEMRVLDTVTSRTHKKN